MCSLWARWELKLFNFFRKAVRSPFVFSKSTNQKRDYFSCIVCKRWWTKEKRKNVLHIFLLLRLSGMRKAFSDQSARAAHFVWNSSSLKFQFFHCPTPKTIHFSEVKHQELVRKNSKILLRRYIFWGKSTEGTFGQRILLCSAFFRTHCKLNYILTSVNSRFILFKRSWIICGTVCAELSVSFRTNFILKMLVPLPDSRA